MRATWLCYRGNFNPLNFPPIGLTAPGDSRWALLQISSFILFLSLCTIRIFKHDHVLYPSTVNALPSCLTLRARTYTITFRRPSELSYCIDTCPEHLSTGAGGRVCTETNESLTNGISIAPTPYEWSQHSALHVFHSRLYSCFHRVWSRPRRTAVGNTEDEK